ncbi:MAG: hypothetical protein HY053_02065 [Proteobacteria bacterium]|nr:hypothetical protein [Pseudomonadota bacterium]
MAKYELQVEYIRNGTGRFSLDREEVTISIPDKMATDLLTEQHENEILDLPEDLPPHHQILKIKLRETSPSINHSKTFYAITNSPNDGSIIELKDMGDIDKQFLARHDIAANDLQGLYRETFELPSGMWGATEETRPLYKQDRFIRPMPDGTFVTVARPKAAPLPRVAAYPDVV